MPANADTCEKSKVDSNVVGLRFAEERCIGVLPDAVANSGLQDGGVWYPMAPNEYDDFGGETQMVSRNPINSSRQLQKGVVTDLDASGGFNQDITHGALQRMLQGFMFADARELPDTHPISDSTLPLISITDVDVNTINLGTGGGAKIPVGALLKLEGMAIGSNNQADILVTGVAGDVLTVTTLAPLTAEVATAAARLRTVGYQFGANVAGIVFSATETLTLTRTGGDFTTEGYNVGEWIFVGGQETANRFVNNIGYARVTKIEANQLTLIEPTWLPVTEVASAPVNLWIYRGMFLRNEKDPTLIKRRSYQFERTLGQDVNGTQSEYLVGAVANELTLNLETAEKMTADLSYVALDNNLRDGAQGLKPGDRTNELSNEDAFNTANDVYQLRLFVTDPLKATPVSLYAKVMEATVNINNNVSADRAIGDLGGFDVTTGDFEVTGEMEAYFSTVEAIRAVKENRDVGFNMISTKISENTGFVYDIPLLSLGGGRLEVEQNEPIKLPLEVSGAENEYGYTLSITHFNHLPDVAMATTT